MLGVVKAYHPHNYRNSGQSKDDTRCWSSASFNFPNSSLVKGGSEKTEIPESSQKIGTTRPYGMQCGECFVRRIPDHVT